MRMKDDDKRIITGSDEQFLVHLHEVGWAVVSVGTLARFREDAAHDGEARVDVLWHLPQSGEAGAPVVPVEPVPARVEVAELSTQQDGQGYPSYRHLILEVVPVASREAVASARYSVDLRS